MTLIGLVTQSPLPFPKRVRVGGYIEQGTNQLERSGQWTTPTNKQIEVQDHFHLVCHDSL